MPSWVVGTPSRLARARPSDCGSMPTIAPISRFFEVRITLIIRSVPILPDPMIAQGIFAISSLILRKRRADGAQARDARLIDFAPFDLDHRPERARHHRVARLQWPSHPGHSLG